MCRASRSYYNENITVKLLMESLCASVSARYYGRSASTTELHIRTSTVKFASAFAAFCTIVGFKLCLFYACDLSHRPIK